MRRQWILIGQSILKTIRTIGDKKCPSRGGRNRTRMCAKSRPVMASTVINGLKIHNFVSFITHGRTRQSNSFNLTTSFCKTSTFQASYFNRIVKLRNTISTSAPKTIFSTLNTFQNHVKETLSDLLKTYDVERPCTWSVVRS